LALSELPFSQLPFRRRLPTPPRSAYTTGVASLCATAQEFQDVTAINYDVTQQDGPGSYQIHYVDLNNGFTSQAQSVGPLPYNQHGFGTMFGDLQHCFRVILTSTAGTDLEASPVCP
jgi:hypothetical protein